jgi:hypothetical protein
MKCNSGMRVFKIIPVLGFFIFIVLFVVATKIYPGGTIDNHSLRKYSWTDNYICDLSHGDALNGEKNSAQMIYITAITVLCLCITILIIQFAFQYAFSSFLKIALNISAIGFFATALTLFTKFHDNVVHLALLFSLCSNTFLLMNLYKIRWLFIFSFGIFCSFLLMMNYCIFLSKLLIDYLPVMQKVTLLMFLTWLSLIAFKRFPSNNH